MTPVQPVSTSIQNYTLFFPSTLTQRLIPKCFATLHLTQMNFLSLSSDVMGGWGGRRAARLYVGYIKCDPGARSFL